MISAKAPFVFDCGRHYQFRMINVSIPIFSLFRHVLLSPIREHLAPAQIADLHSTRKDESK